MRLYEVRLDEMASVLFLMYMETHVETVSLDMLFWNLLKTKTTR